MLHTFSTNLIKFMARKQKNNSYFGTDGVVWMAIAHWTPSNPIP